jgi:DNA-binding MarR family transcriptional regulator
MTKRLDSSTASLAFTSIVPRLLLKQKRSLTSFDCMRKEGMGATEIAKAVGCKRGNVYKTLKAAGLN